MSKRNDGGPAFPYEHGHSPDACNVREHGMTLRDYFAAKAMQGMMARESCRLILREKPYGCQG